MAKLILTLDGALLGEHDLDKEMLTIGRRPSNDVHIDNLAISGSHAAVRTLGNDYFLEDLDSTNGTFVNGKSVKKHLLQHGDVIELGKYHLRFVNEAALNAVVGGGQEDFEKTMIIRPSAMQSITVERESPSVSAQEPALAEPPKAESAKVELAKTEQPQTSGPGPVAHIQVLNGPGAGRELVLNKTLTTIGKPGVQVAVITRRPQGFFITHVEGPKPPTVNGVSAGVQAYELSNHDVIELAGVKMEFFLSGG